MVGPLSCEKCGLSPRGEAVGGLCASCLLELAFPAALEGEPAAPPPGSDPVSPAGNRRFGDYELLEEVARGGMGVVFRALQVSLNRIVALKILLHGELSTPSMVGRFQIEAQAAARLEHPGLVPVYEIGSHGSWHYFSMRFLEGGTLTQTMAAGTLDPKRAVEIMAKVTRAVHHAHQRGILHRDLKPANILFDQDGEPLVADFGLARMLDHNNSLTQNCTTLGTPSYMAPEQAAGPASELSTAADIYSLGVILYELLAGRVPFRGQSLAETLRQVMENEPDRGRLMKPGVDHDLATVCLKCLAKDPQRRYASCDALAEDLERWLTHRPVRARPPSAPERVWKWALRKPMVAGLVAALHAVGLAGFIGIVWQYDNARNEARRATDEAQRANAAAVSTRQEFLRAESELWNANLSEARAVRSVGGSGARTRSTAILNKLIQRPGLTEPQILSLREEAVAHQALTDLEKPATWVSLQPVDRLSWNSTFDQYVHHAGSNQLEVRAFPSERVVAAFSGPPGSIVSQAAFSPDNRLLVARFSNAGGAVIGWNLADSRPVLNTVCENRRQERFIEFSPDSRTLALITPKGLTLHSLADPSPPRVIRENQSLAKLAFSPDSTRIAAVAMEAPDTVEIWDAETGVTRCAFSTGFAPSVISWHPEGSQLLLGGDRGLLELRQFNPGQSGDTVGPSRLFLGHVSLVEHAFFSPDGRNVISYGWDQTSLIWDRVSARILLREPAMALRGIHPCGLWALATRDNPLTESMATLLPCPAFRTVEWAGAVSESLGVWISPDGALAVVNRNSSTPGAEGECLIWSLSKGMELARVKGCWAQFSRDGHTLYCFERYQDNRVRSYDVRPETLANPPASWSDGTLVYQGGPDEAVNTGMMAADSRTLLIATTNAVVFHDTQGGHPPRRMSMPAHTLETSNDGRWLATAHHNHDTMLWTASDGKPVLALGAKAVARFSRDNRWLAVVDQRAVQILELPSFRKAYPPIASAAGTGITVPLAFSADSRIFAVAYNRTHVRLHETSTGALLATLSPPIPAPIIGDRALAFSPDDQWLLAAKNDGETIAWNIPMLRSELHKIGLDWKN